MIRSIACLIALSSTAWTQEPLFKPTGEYAVEAKPVSEVPAERFPRVLFFHASWCNPCHVALDENPVKTNFGCRKWMESGGYEFGESPRSHVQLVDVDKHPELVKRYHVGQIPAIVLLTGDDAKARAVSYAGRQSIVDLFYPPAKSHHIAGAGKMAGRQVVQHAHQCGRCGFKWWHGAENNGHRNAHVCAKCGAVQYQQTGETRIVRIGQ